METSRLLAIILFCLFNFNLSNAQTCETVADWEDEMIDEPLQPAAPFGGYFTVSGTPSFVEENCTPGGSVGLRLKAGIDGAVGDVVGYTQSFGILPQPTFLNGATYNISGKKLYTNQSMGTYENLNMTITLVGGAGAVQVVNKSLMLIQGQCDSWDPPQTFVSPGDFDLAEITITATNGAGEDDLHIVIDDWCIEEVVNEDCFAEFGYQQIDECGGVQFLPNIIGGMFDSWQISGPNGYSSSSNVENLIIDLPFSGTYVVTIGIICEDGSLQTFDQTITIDFFDEDPIFEACEEGSTVEITGTLVDGECVAEYVIPDLLPSDDSGVFTVTCFLDSTIPVVAGQVVTLTAGTHQLFCNIIDGCENEASCFFTINVTCESDEPCDYECCLDGPNWPVEGYEFGDLPLSNPTGFYPEYGSPQIVEDGCDDSTQSIELNGVTLGFGGDAAGLRNNGTPPTPIFEEGNTYCISFCMKVIGGNEPRAKLTLQASNVPQSNAGCTGSCEVIGDSRIVQEVEGWVTETIIYTPTTSFDNLIFLNNDTGTLDFPSDIRFDNVCITENPEPIACKVDIIIEEQECGKVIVTTEDCGEIESHVILWDDGFESFESNDTTVCIEYPSAGPWTVTVNYTCADGTSKTTSKTFTLENKIGAPVITCPSDTLIMLDPEGECIADVLLGTYTVDDPSASVNCYVSGILVTNPSIPVQIPEGIAQIEYIATNECGADTCSYEIEVKCEEINDKYDCPIDVLFVLDNSGSISPTEFNQMVASANTEIAALSSVYTNSRYATVHYTGACGEKLWVENDFTASGSLLPITRKSSGNDDLNLALGSVIKALNNTLPDPDITGGPLNLDPLAKFYVVIFTDAGKDFYNNPMCANSALVPYTNANTLKSTFGANISIVHFQPGISDDACGAIASPGGTYTGAVDVNTGDPDNLLLPRQYIQAPFGTPNIDLLSVIPPCEPCFDCDDLVLTSMQTSEDSCCYSIDLNNGIGPDIVKMEAEIITPDWQFNTATTNPGAGFQWFPGTVTTGNKLCLTGSSNIIPTGPNPGILNYCFSPAVASPSGPQVVVFKYYSILNDTLFELQCTDTLTTECMPVINDPCLDVQDISFECNPDNAYEYIVNLTVTNNSGFTASNVTLSGIGGGFQFASCSSSTGTNSISIPVPGGLADGATTTVCVKIIAPVPILNPTAVCFNIGINSFFDCCHSPDEVCITLDPCCDPCADITTTFSPISVTGQDQCCYTLQVDYECDYLYFNKIRFSSQTTGVTFGYHALGNTNFQMCGSSSTDLCIEPTTSPLAKGNYLTVMDICLDGINDPSQIPQIVKVDYITVDQATNQDTVACSQDLTFECDIIDNKCLEVSNQDLVCLPDSMKYRYTFDIKNVSSLPFTATDVDVFIISPSDLIFTPSGGTFPLTPALATGSSETITSCIESTTSTFPSTATNIIFGYRLRYNAGDTCCYESLFDTIAIPPCDDVPAECFSVVDIEAKNVICDAPDCYNDPYCQAWLVDRITNASCIGVASTTVEKAFHNGNPVFVVKEQYYDTDIETIYDCDGSIIQVCSSWMGLPTTCNPNAGINILTDLTSVQLLWDCTMAIPTYDPAVCLSGSGLTQVDYCVKIMNNSPTGYLANQFDLSGISPSGVTITPMTHATSIPSGGMATINFSVSGNLAAGDIVKIEGLLSGLDNMEESWECKDTICLEVPPCPIEDCCTDEETFNNNVNQGFQITNLGDCTYQVCANQFDTCHWFPNLSPDWGDGSILLPSVLQSNPPNNCWTHTYTSNGTFKISLPVFEGDSIDDACWNGLVCGEVVAECCDEDPCDDVNITITQLSTVEDSCCTLFTIDNNFCDDYFKGFRVEMVAPATVSQISGLNGYVVNQITPQVAEVKPLFGFVGLGVRDAFTLCSTDYDTDPHNVTISWLVPSGDTCVAECAQDFEISCDVGDEDKCFEFVTDSIHCESGTYCFKIKNISSPGFDINSVHLYDLSGSLGLTPTGRITIPTLTPGMTSDWICVNYFGVMIGDVACYKISAHNTPANLPPTTCCTDTLETCFTIPDCPQEVCGTCPDGNVGGANLVSNGDFEQGTGYAGWSSGYNQELFGLMRSNEYSVRNSTNLVNTQWRAIDHTSAAVTGQFLAIDGPSGNVAYSTSVNVVPNTDYVFCMWVDNLVSTSTPSNPVIEVKIGGTIVEAGRWLPKNPDGWQLITLNYNSGSNNGAINIEVSDIATTTQFNDWAIDDVSFRECGPPVDICCDDLDPAAIFNYYNANITVTNNECEGCVTVDIDSCDIAFVDFGTGEIQLTDLTPECQTFTAGVHPFTIRVVRLNANGDVCFEETFDRSFDIDCPPVDDCCDVTVADILTYYGQNIISDRDSCDICVMIDVDTCDVFEFRYDNDPFVLYAGMPTVCKSYTDPGPHFYSYRVTRFDMNGDTCFHDTFNAQFDLLCDTISDPDPCCDDIDVVDLDAYYFNNTSFGTSPCAACVIVDLDSCDVGTVTFSGGSPQPLQDNVQACRQYSTSGNYSYTIEVVRYNTDGDTCYYYQNQQSFDLECDNEPPIHPCVQIVADSIDCESNTYCFKVRNNTAPAWTIRSLAFVNESAGHTLTPDPISITPLAVGDTTDWICVDYTAFSGDTVCFNLVAHQEDIAAGEEPEFCCSNPEPVCFVVPDCQQCLACPNNGEEGPNLIMNPDFEGGYNGFTSDYTLTTTGTLSQGEYSIRNSITLDNSQWTALDHTTGSSTGNFLVLDGPSTDVAYRTTVVVKPNTQYVFCMFAANLVNTDLDSDPTIELSIDGVVQIPGLTIPKQVGKWWIISVPYFSGMTSGMVDIEIKDIDTDPFNDWAIDDVSFRECVVEKVCCEDEDLFDDLLDIAWTVSVDTSDCSVTVSAPQLDSCHWISQSEPDWGDGSVSGQVITSAVGSWTHTYATSGTYTVCATIFEGDDGDEFCFDGEMCTEVVVDCSTTTQPPECNKNDVIIYNALSPNGDGLNDRLRLDGGVGCVKDIYIYNRWGQLVWSEKEYGNSWNGQSFKGEKLPSGTYFLVVEFPLLEEDNMIQTYIDLRND